MKPETIKESASGAYKVLGEIRHLLTIWACRKRLLTGETNRSTIVLHTYSPVRPTVRVAHSERCNM